MTRMVRTALLVIVLGVLAGAALLAGQRYLEDRVGHAVETTLTELPGILRVTYGGVRVNVVDRTADVHDLTLVTAAGGPEFRVRRLHVRDYQAGERLPERLEVELHDVEWVRGGDAFIHRLLEDALQGPVLGDVSLAMGVDAESGRLSLERLVVALLSGDELRVQARLRPATRNAWSECGGSLCAPVLEWLDARWHGGDLVRPLLGRLARQRGMARDTLIAVIASELDRTTAQWQGAMADGSVDALQRFLRNPGMLRLQVAPDNPVALVPLWQRMLVNPPGALQQLAPALAYRATQHDPDDGLAVD